MCYDDHARPPDPPGTRGTARGEDLVLTAADGNQFAAYAAHPDQPTGAQILIYPDVRGLFQFYKDLALRFGEVGIAAVAIDYFGRTAGLTGRDESFEFMPHVGQLTLDGIYADARAALAYLRQGAGAGQPTFITGFCIGGTLTLYSGTQAEFGVAGLIPFYSGFRRALDPRGTALDAATEVKAPVLGLYGGADQGIPEEQVHELGNKLTQAGVEHELVIYPGAPHSFFDRYQTEYADASTDAWTRVLAFIAAHTSKQ
jgi:carboxymethylenebutenolidase